MDDNDDAGDTKWLTKLNPHLLHKFAIKWRRKFDQCFKFALVTSQLALPNMDMCDQQI